ncbi:adenylyl cyclase [Intrasporangium chromatireducens Q5-1]|uniref:Adenylyl cyclase n=1 Tax=Intrasporangium chromatireducens Q5-1 TaxID=584657 RepID=W9GK66_9MICO|nr:MBL fold metallo-hydrolase [Intrasporangium chromatireducens]EWT06646.1 adenylyl cyclase [Intrasporangium chromatireducens Q5-1]
MSTGSSAGARCFTEVADRVFHARFPQWDVGVGLVLGRDGAVVVDTRASAIEGGEVVTAVRRQFPHQRIGHVVNTHVHFDHTFGNIAFAGATIHAHDNVARDLEADAERIRGLFAADPGDGPELGYTAADVADVLATRLRHPDRTFTTSATIDLGDRVVTLTHRGRGHTDGDIAIAVPDADAVFLGDLVEESAPPSLGSDSWPLEWGQTLAAHLAWIGESTVVVPGHGRPVDRQFVRRQGDELGLVADVLRERRRAGMTLADAQREPDDRLPYPLDHLAAAAACVWAQLESDPEPPDA